MVASVVSSNTLLQAAVVSEAVMQIPVDRIIANPLQPRKTFSQKTLAGLAETIKEYGVMHPIEVFQMDDQFVLIDGERRWRAAKLAGLTVIDVLVKPAPENEMLLLRAIVANVHSEPMNPVEEGHAYRRLLEDYSKSVAEIARQTGKQRSHVENRMLLTTLDPEIQVLVASDKLSHDPRVARALLKIENPAARIVLASSLAEKKASIQQCLEATARMRSAVAIREEPELSLKQAKSPALVLASHRKDGPPNNWNALVQVGKLPEWEAVVDAANATCGRCELKDMASRAVCGRCQAVDLLTALIDGASK